jgi:GT2 family glycosyltransferase
LTAGRELGVVVLTHGRAGAYPPLLSSLIDQGVPASSIVIAHNPVDPSDPAIVPAHAGITVLRMPGNLAYAGGMNAGVRHHLGRGAGLLLLLTHDVRLRPGAVTTLVEAADRAPEFGVLGPLLWNRGEDKVFSYGGRSGERGGWVGHILDGPPPASDGIAECEWVDGAALLIRRHVFDQAGLLDERLFIYFEETELCLRARRAGWKVGVVLAAEAEQESGQPARPGFHAYLTSRNGFEYARKVNGAVAVLATVRRSLTETLQLLGAYRRAGPDERRSARVKVVGMWLGFLDFLIRRFGPPPPRVKRLDAS